MKKPLGSIIWTDLTIQNATEVKDFYEKVVGWQSNPLSMGVYDDYLMITNKDDQGTAGICHAKGPNTNIPPQWMIYVTVSDVALAVEACLSNGGKVIDGPRKMGDNDFAIIQDPAGAVMGIITDK